MKNTPFRYGFTAGCLVAFVNLTFLFVQDKAHPDYGLGEVIGYTSMVLGLLVVYFGIRYERDQVLGGSITFGKALRVGLAISAMAALAFALVDTLYITLLEPDFMQHYLGYTVEQMRAQGHSEADIAQVTAQYAMMKGPVGIVFNAVIMFLTVMLIGLIETLISALMLRREP